MSEHQLNLKNLPKRKKNKERAGVPVDWAAHHGPVSGAISATTGAGAAALLGAAVGAPPALPLVIGAAGALGHGVGHSVFRRLTGRTIATRAASWLLAGGWTTWAMTTGPLSWAAAGSLTALGVGIATAASGAAAREEAAEELRISQQAAKESAALNRERLAVAREWEDRIWRVCRIRVTVFAVEHWPTGAGYSIAAELPGGGAMWEQIAQRCRALATDARLPLGCTVQAEEGDVQGRVVLDVATRNVMAETITYPTPYTPLSILTGIPWGVRPTGEEIRVFLREACALILGPPGSGKSTFIDAVIAGFARCVDVLVWVIDLKAGAAGIPWMRPWLEANGLTEPLPGLPAAPEGTRPGIDWLASTPAEAALMLDAALAINAARQQGYQRLMAEENTTLLPIGAHIPQIMIVVDEGAEALTASHKDPARKAVGDKLRQVMRTTRAMGARCVLTAVDGNVSAIGDTQVRKFSPIGVALTSGETVGNNLGKLFPRTRIDTAQLSQKGAGVIGDGGAEGFAPTPFKGWKTGPGMVRDVILATNHTRPELDEISAEAAGTAYTERWSKARAGWLWNSSGPDRPATAPAPPTARPETGQGGVPGLNLSYKRQTDPPAGQLDADAMAARLMEEIDREFGTTNEPTRPAPAAPGPGLNLSYKRQPDAPPEPDARTAALRLIIDAGPEGTGASAMERALAPDHGTRRPVIQRWLKEWAEEGEIVRVGEGSKARYVHHTHAPTPPTDH
ncbi:hypothetical protein [Streptomyces sp. ST2-7A]|uniref:hypothetical protein n=1 Tax=Streptomyces sp. ST2-7A TaxID=2907214 RepID=UPI001F37AC9A|nr:hypothetical protein [Streptomyces sp. ST2-7A]MCE7080712.1 hypothetical protein [Streptomyces sp. ST2-7A]